MTRHTPGRSMARSFKTAEKYRYFICLLIFASYVLVFFHRLCPAVIALEMQEDFGISGTLLGLLGSTYFYAYAIMQLPTGLMVDSWGPRKTVSVFFVLAALGSILMGMASNVTMAITGRTLVGVGVSTLFVSNFKLLAEWFSPRRFVIMGGIFMSMGGLGALSSSAPLAWISDLIGWRMTLVTVGLLSLFMAALVYAFVRDRPSDMGFPPPFQHQCGKTNAKIGLIEGLRQVVLAARFWPISLWAFFATGITFSLGGLWGGPFLMQVYGMSKAAAGGVLSMFALALIIGGPLLSWTANRAGRKPVIVGCSITLTAVFAILYAYTDRLSPAHLYILFFCFCLAGAAPGPVIAAVSKELFPIDIAGTSVGAVNLFPFFGGAFFQVFIGAILNRNGLSGAGYAVSGYREMFLVCLIGAVISLIVSLFLRETLGRTN